MKQILKKNSWIVITLLLMLSACKKKESDPIAITVTAKQVSIVTNYGATLPDDVNILFDYNGSQKLAKIHSVSEGFQTGTARISNPDVVPPVCSFITTGLGTESVGINSMNLPDTIQINITSFDGIYSRSLNKGFNKVTMVFDANTKFYMSGHADFGTYNASNVPIFKAKALLILSKLNDYQPAVAGEQRLPVFAYVED